MKRKFLLLAAIIACSVSYAQTNKVANAAIVESTFTVEGHIDGLTSSSGDVKGMNFTAGYVYLSGIIRNGTDIKDSAKITNGNFVFKGKADEPSRVTVICKPDNYDYYVISDFFLDNSYISLKGKYDESSHSIKELTIKGSTLETDYNKILKEADYYSGLAKIQEDLQNARKKNDKATVCNLQKKMGEGYQKKAEYLNNYITSHADSYISLYLICNSQAAMYLSTNSDFSSLSGLENQIKALSPAIQETFLAKNFLETIDTKRKGLLIGPGKPAIDFAQPDIDGNMVKLSDYKGKYLLIDFWASWCGGCRAENPNVMKAYEKYHAKGLEILSISMDNSKKAWLKAIQDDKLPWKQVSDLKGWDNTAGKSYMIQAIPENFLIGPDGNIIAKSLRGEGLGKTLSEIFK